MTFIPHPCISPEEIPNAHLAQLFSHAYFSSLQIISGWMCKLHFFNFLLLIFLASLTPLCPSFRIYPRNKMLLSLVLNLYKTALQFVSFSQLLLLLIFRLLLGSPLQVHQAIQFDASSLELFQGGNKLLCSLCLQVHLWFYERCLMLSFLPPLFLLLLMFSSS